MRICKDCTNETSTDFSIRCITCHKAQRKIVSKINRETHKYEKTPVQRYSTYQKGAIFRQLEFNLSFEQFMEFWQKPCYYCGDLHETIGIDRLLNSKGYIIDNIVSCCKVRNFMKHTMNEQDFINKCKQIASYSTKPT
jgi:hypothetical protein